MTHYFKANNIINVEPSDALEVLDHLPAAAYIVKKNDMTGKLYLQTTDVFELPSKIYGDTDARASRICTTFEQRSKSTGVLLSGDKGSGKTLLAKVLANTFVDSGSPVIIVNEPWCGQVFNELIGHIKQPAMVFFDEFDKVYDKDEQKELLTLLDGTVETKKLFVLTTNAGHVDEHLINRPGRIYYKFNYRGIDEQFVREYAEDNLNDKTQIDLLVTIINSFVAFTFDMLQTIIEEMNRYNESAEVAIQNLNIDMTKESVSYQIRMLYNNKPVDNSYWPQHTDTNPIFGRSQPLTLDISFDDKRVLKDDFEKDFPEIEISQAHLKSITSGGVMLLKYDYKGNDILVAVEPKKGHNFNWMAF